MVKRRQKRQQKERKEERGGTERQIDRKSPGGGEFRLAQASFEILSYKGDILHLEFLPAQV